MVKVALITGINGQDGSYLAELLLQKGYQVHGLLRRGCQPKLNNLSDIKEDIQLHFGDLSDAASLFSVLAKVRPDEIYNLGAQTHVKASFEIPVYTGDINALGTTRLLELIRAMGLLKDIRFYQASTSELYGLVQEIPQSETTPFYPRSPYGVAKLYSYWMVKNYREAYGLHGSNGILFNHESPRRGETFVSRKITLGVAGIKKGAQEKISLGNLNAKRDWGHAKDYVYGQWLMLQQDQPNDYVLATGEQHSVREFVEKAFSHISMGIVWEGQGLNELGKDSKTGKILVDVDPRFFRPTEVESLLGDPTKAKTVLGWVHKYDFDNLIKDMVESELN